MASVRVTVNQGALHSLLSSPTGPVSRAMLRKGILVSNAAKVLCPVDTGRLRSSIGVRQTFSPTGATTIVGTVVEYGGYIEYGTSRMRAQPYLRPALRAVEGAQ
jgi:HK97 gp10 family phage protein